MIGAIWVMQTILIVEDDAAVRGVMRHMLQKHGYTILEAGGAPRALEIAEQHRGAIDLMVTDVVLPEMRCGPLVNRIRELRPNLRVLYVSGYSEETIGLSGIDGGEPNFMRKPFTPEALRTKVREILARPRIRAAGLS
jgi:two-component system cell cycle sensor histidine kinase/response regulator CckA